MNSMNNDFLPFALPSIGDDEIEEVVDSLRTGWITTGPKVAAFEQGFSREVGADYALAVNSATAGLHLALEAVGVGPGDKVVTTPFTFTATAEVVRYLGADPVFVDIDPSTLNLDVDKLEKVLEKLRVEGGCIKAVIPVHYAGHPCDMDRIMALSEQFGFCVVEDAAHAFPCRYRDRAIGSIGHVTVFSFYATKTITTGEGGMVTTSNEEIAKRIRVMRLHGISKDVWNRYTTDSPDWYYEVVAPGYKYNMTDIAAAMGIHQLKKAEAFRARRAEIASQYNNAFSGYPVQLPPAVDTVSGSIHSWHLYVLRLLPGETGIDRNEFIRLMTEAGVGTSVHFIPLHIQPYWRDTYNYHENDYPVTNRVWKQVISLPIYPAMEDANIDKVVSAVCRIFDVEKR